MTSALLRLLLLAAALGCVLALMHAAGAGCPPMLAAGADAPLLRVRLWLVLAAGVRALKLRRILHQRRDPRCPLRPATSPASSGSFPSPPGWR